MSGLLHGVESGLKKFSSVVFFLALTALSLVFLLKDGPQIRAWAERHAGVPLPLAETISRRSLESLRGYFFGVTLVAAFKRGAGHAGRPCPRIVVQLLASGVLQQMVQPIAYGAALGIHPLAVLIVSIAGGSLFGAAGLILAAPVTSAAVRVSADIARAR